jgi:hypothetical protein
LASDNQRFTFTDSGAMIQAVVAGVRKINLLKIWEYVEDPILRVFDVWQKNCVTQKTVKQSSDRANC